MICRRGTQGGGTLPGTGRVPTTLGTPGISPSGPRYPVPTVAAPRRPPRPAQLDANSVQRDL